MKYLKYLSSGAVLEESDKRAVELVAKGSHVRITVEEYADSIDKQSERYTIKGAIVPPKKHSVPIELDNETFAALKKRFQIDHLHSMEDGIAMLAGLYAKGARIFIPGVKKPQPFNYLNERNPE